MGPFDESDKISDLEGRLAKLEKKKIEVKDLPVKSLQAALAKVTFGQNPTDLLLPNSVGNDLIADEVLEPFIKPADSLQTGIKIDFGRVTLLFAASSLSEPLLVAHELETIPIAVVATSWNAPSGPKVPKCNSFAHGKSTFAINADLDEAHTGGIDITWIAIG